LGIIEAGMWGTEPTEDDEIPLNALPGVPVGTYPCQVKKREDIHD
jgi:hypothetical protein